MGDATRSHFGRELAALGHGGEALPMLKSIGDDS